MNLEFNSPTCYRGSSNNLNLKVFNQLHKILFKKVTQLHFKDIALIICERRIQLKFLLGSQNASNSS